MVLRSDDDNASGNIAEPDTSDIFECRKCGDCCTGYGGTFVSEKDIQAIADFIGIDRERFVKAYCQLSGDKPLLAQGENGKCVFWDGLCTIHPVKPRMCKAWPFIEGVLRHPENWDIMASVCPGMRTNVPREVLLKIVKTERLKLEPDQDA